MKFLKSSVAKKIIIILIALLVFNIAIPHEVKAWDVAGILMKPIFSFVLSNLVTVDVSIGIMLNGLSGGVNVIGAIVDFLLDESHEAVIRADAALQQIFIGPDSIFSGKVRLLNANIFNDNLITGVVMNGSSSAIEGLADLVTPRSRYGKND